MADFEDANSPTWENCIEGQLNLTDALARTIELDTGREALRARTTRSPSCSCGRAAGTSTRSTSRSTARPMSGVALRLRPLLLPQPRARTGATSTCRSSRATSRRASGTTSSCSRRTQLGVPRGTIRATVLIETILAAFEMDEILYELREHSAGLNAAAGTTSSASSRSSATGPSSSCPIAARVTMAVPFMRAYCELLVQDLPPPRRARDGRDGGVHPVAARPRGERRALAKVREDKEREAGQGFDGTWVAHPELVPIAREVFDRVLGEPAEPDRPAARTTSRVDAADAARRRGDARRRSPSRACATTSRSASSTSTPGSAARARPDLQPDGGRGDRRDLALAGLAMAPPRPGPGRDGAPPDRRGGDPARPGLRGKPARCSSRSRRSRDYVEFLTLPAYDRLDD